MEKELIELATKYVNIETGTESETIVNRLFDLAPQVEPLTAAGRAIVAWVKAEEVTDFSMSAGDEFEEMCRTIKL